LPLRLNLVTVAFDDPLVLLDLLLIVLILRFVLSLHVISDERARTEPDSATNRGAQSRTTGGGADEPAGGGASNCADPRAFFPWGQGTAGAAHSSERSKAQRNHPSRRPKLIYILFHSAS
jgi:hypothetical protein